jgi:hypothetical protein
VAATLFVQLDLRKKLSFFNFVIVIVAITISVNCTVRATNNGATIQYEFMKVYNFISL